MLQWVFLHIALGGLRVYIFEYPLFLHIGMFYSVRISQCQLCATRWMNLTKIMLGGKKPDTKEYRLNESIHIKLKHKQKELLGTEMLE